MLLDVVDPSPPPNAPNPGFGDAAVGLVRRGAATVRGAALDVAGTARAARFDPPPRDQRARRLGYGVALPFAVLRAVWRDPEARRAYLRITIPQALFTVIGGTWFAWSTHRFSGRHELGEGSYLTISDSLASLSALYGVLVAFEWVAVALSREYLDRATHLASLASGALPEEQLPPNPSIRVNLRWVWKKAKRRLRGFLVFASGIPLLALAQAVPEIGDYLYAVLGALWGAYWLAVFAASKTAHAWFDEDAGRDPWFLRGFGRLVEQSPAPRAARWYVRLWRRIVRRVAAPATRLEESPYEFVGLAVARAIRIPGLYTFLRPLVPVAATHAMLSPARAAQLYGGTVPTTLVPFLERTGFAGYPPPPPPLAAPAWSPDAARGNTTYPPTPIAAT